MYTHFFFFCAEINLALKNSCLQIFSLSLLHTHTRTHIHTHTHTHTCPEVIPLVILTAHTRTHTHTHIHIYTNLSSQAECDIRSIFKRSLTSLNSDFSFSKTGCHTNVKELSLLYYLPIAEGRITECIPFPNLRCKQFRLGFEPGSIIIIPQITFHTHTHTHIYIYIKRDWMIIPTVYKYKKRKEKQKNHTIYFLYHKCSRFGLSDHLQNSTLYFFFILSEEIFSN